MRKPCGKFLLNHVTISGIFRQNHVTNIYFWLKKLEFTFTEFRKRVFVPDKMSISIIESLIQHEHDMLFCAGGIWTCKFDFSSCSWQH